MSIAGDFLYSWFRSGQLPDGRVAFGLYLDNERVYACFDYEVHRRAQRGLVVPNPGDEPAPDGYVTRWEQVL